MNDMAKIVRNGTRQSVELPEGFGFDGDEVHVRRDGARIVLESAGEIDADTGLPMETLRALIQEGLDSGPSEVWDTEALKREMRARLK
ncbi:hypothetical protein ASG29_07610 [Sphingomonas sp. Leaf412]|uniref:hypothetical protein n=1 Tax=Sphingomonas sp. Leaf412 TaxID=1736370 RepID=UPI0006FB5254|nr:hypothetical protein [Sphingomonas sp. Leaf412]KQT31773.1 hypothetical protein ASG29_07610 [Sphingomonas sp. Leaf412]